jgi:hypothetical protein
VFTSHGANIIWIGFHGGDYEEFRFGGTYRLHLQGRKSVSEKPAWVGGCRHYVRFEVFTEVTTKNSVFWDVAPCSSCMNRCFGGTYRLHLQGRKSMSEKPAWAGGCRHYVRFEVFTEVTMKNSVFWDVEPCSSCVKRRFGGTSVHTRTTRRHNPEKAFFLIWILLTNSKEML